MVVGIARFPGIDLDRIAWPPASPSDRGSLSIQLACAVAGVRWRKLEHSKSDETCKLFGHCKRG